jgi:hypothetical protein
MRQAVVAPRRKGMPQKDVFHVRRLRGGRAMSRGAGRRRRGHVLVVRLRKLRGARERLWLLVLRRLRAAPGLRPVVRGASGGRLPHRRSELQGAPIPLRRSALLPRRRPRGGHPGFRRSLQREAHPVRARNLRRLRKLGVRRLPRQRDSRKRAGRVGTRVRPGDQDRDRGNVRLHGARPDEWVEQRRLARRLGGDDRRFQGDRRWRRWWARDDFRDSFSTRIGSSSATATTVPRATSAAVNPANSVRSGPAARRRVS